MSFDAILWMLLPLFVAAGSALLSFVMMQAKLEVAVSRERETAVRLQAQLGAQQQSVEDKVRAAGEEAARKSFDNFLADIRVDERHYMRESKSLFMNRKSMVLQERLYFRNIPLSNWVEHEMTLEEGGDVSRLARAASVFMSGNLPEGDAPADLPPGRPRLVKNGNAGWIAG